MQYSNGVRPYVLEWYQDVFLPTYNQKQNPDSKASPDDKYILEESRNAVTTQQLADATFDKKGKKISTKYVRQTYLDQLINQGYVDSVSSQLDKRAEIYFPVVTTTTTAATMTEDKNNKKYADTPNTPFSVESPIFPTQNYIRSKILALLEYADENTIVEIKNNYDVNDFIEKYYNSPENVFHEIITQQQTPPPPPVRQAQEEELKAEAVRKNILYQQQILQNICKSQGLSAYPNGAENKLCSSNEGEKYDIDGKKVYSPISLYSCYHCTDFQTNNKYDYECHVISKHELGHPCYPCKADIERLGLKAQGKSWEI